MNYITITAPSYEDAVRQAREQYGDKLRIHTRKDVVKKGFLGIGKTKHCELTCYLLEKENLQPVTKTEDIKEEVENNKKADFIGDREMKRYEQEARTPNPEN